MPEKGEKTIGELISELTQEVRMLFRQEMELFTVEMKGKAIHVAKDAVAMGVGGVLLYSGLLVLLAAVVLGLATVMPAWGAALLVAVACIAAGIALVLKGQKDLVHLKFTPEQTAESVKETAKWAKTLKSTSSHRRTSFGSRSDIRKAI
ncbi:membrane protein [Geoanaerobacter pelophilus]|uniref:Membrane protein n=1 Tax=Geoanaerobacter pelophilus TaxID=60036 RepID=A0ABQ0MF11_9BACT|nr:phage holin family protein [Geoanaerobacter pelophilus]GAW65676.1 membrane protein [Geoanaerobacter pelophilus]